MTIGALLLALSVALAVAAALSARWRPRLAAQLARAHAAALLLALAALVLAFLASDVSYRYVWSHTSATYPIWYKLAGTWGGEEGTLLLWAAAVATALVLVLRRADASALHRRAAGALLALSGALAAIDLLVGAFDPTDAASLALAPAGRGLADVLLTPLMVIHPPIQFIGYALTAVPAAFAVAHLLSDEGAGKSTGTHSDPSPARDRAPVAWIKPAFRWARAAWLFATVGLGLGALWAYYVLSFGGYWAWDPVETANLLPWLALTAFLHAGKHLEKFGDHALSSIALAGAAALLTLFATFATRSGLWVSVHAFTDPTGTFEPDAAARLLAILRVHAPTRLLLGVFTAATLAFVALVVHHRGRAGPRGPARLATHVHAGVLFALAGAALLDPRAAWGALFAATGGGGAGLAIAIGALVGAPFVVAYLAQEDRARRWKLEPRLVMSVAVALFAIAVFVAFAVNVQVINGPDRRVFDVRAPYVVLPMVSALTLMLALAPFGRLGAVALTGAAIVAGVLAWAVFPASRTLALATPFLLGALVATVAKLAHVQGRPEGGRARGVALLLVGLALIATLANPPTDVMGFRIGEGASLALGFAGVAAGALLVVLAVRSFRGRLERARLRETGIYVIHLAVVLGLLGYGASTYSQSREVFAAVPVGSDLAVGAYTIHVGTPIVRTVDGALDAASVPLHLARSGHDAGDEPLEFAWRGAPSAHYAPRLDVRRTVAEDVYLSPLAFHTKDGWVGATTATGQRVAASDVDMVTFTASVLPLMDLVWAGLWMGAVGMAMVLASDAPLRYRS